MKKRKIINPTKTVLQENIKKWKGVGMKDSGLKLLCEAALLHPIETEVDKIEETEDSTPNVDVKLGIDIAPKKL